MNDNKINRIITLWAFSEAALGGILHAFKIPFTGLFVGSSAVIFISLIAYFADSRKQILNSTMKVILVKFLISPHSPLTAYFAVAIQGILGYILFFRGFNSISPIILGIISLLLSAFQKLIIISLTFGMTIWESIDIFSNFIIKKLIGSTENDLNISVSYILVGSYILIHLVGGLLAGIYSSRFPSKIKKRFTLEIDSLSIETIEENIEIKNKYKTKIWWKKSSYLFIIILSLMLIILSFYFEEVNSNIVEKLIFMVFRSFLILTVWYFVISPFVYKIFNKYISKKMKNKSLEIEKITTVFPTIKAIIKHTWNDTIHYGRVTRVFYFVDQVLVNFLLYKGKDDE